jgi:predicted phage tail component-like protein
MVLYTPDGRVSIDLITLSDGSPIVPGQMFTADGVPLLEFIDHTIPVYTLTSDLHTKALQNTRISYTITLTCTNSADPGNNLIVNAPLPSQFTFVDYYCENGTYNDSTGVWNVILPEDNQTAYLNLIVTPNTAATASQTVTLEFDSTSVSKSCVISASDSDTINYNDEALTTFTTTLNNLKDGQIYTVIKYCKVDDSAITAPYDGIKNNRLVIINGSTYYGQRIVTEGQYEKIYCTFVYDDANPITIRTYGNYQSVSTTDISRWAGLCINEGLNFNYSESTNLLTNPDAMLDDTSSTDLTLNAGESSARYTFSFPTQTIIGGTNPFITGMQISFNSIGTNSSAVTIYAVTDEDYITETKSTYISQNGLVTLGNTADLWDLTDLNIEDHTIDFNIIWNNTSQISKTITFNNLVLNSYWMDDVTNGTNGFTWNGVHSKNYQLILDDDNAGVGVNNELNLLSMSRSDGQLILSQDIRAKEFDLEMFIVNYDIEDASMVLNNIGRWLTNPRNSLGMPTEQELIFDHDTTKRYLAILDGEIEVTKDQPLYQLKAKFIVPDGVARSVNPKITGYIGTNEGAISVRPIVDVVADGSPSIVLTDSISGQSITLNTTVTGNTLVSFDCENRTVTDENDNDLTEYVTINSIWFNFISDYNVSATGATVQSITYYEGY